MEKYKGKNKENENNGPYYEEMKVKGTGELAQHFRLLSPAGDEFSTHTRGSQPPVPPAPWDLTPPSGPWAPMGPNAPFWTMGTALTHAIPTRRHILDLNLSFF